MVDYNQIQWFKYCLKEGEDNVLLTKMHGAVMGFMSWYDDYWDKSVLFQAIPKEDDYEIIYFATNDTEIVNEFKEKFIKFGECEEPSSDQLLSIKNIEGNPKLSDRIFKLIRILNKS